jgi:hypothetical protein
MTAYDNYRNDEEIQTVVCNLFLGCAPERETDLRDLWRQLAPEFQLTGPVDEGARFVMKAGCYRYVRFNHRVLRAFWIGGFAAWEGFAAVQKSVTSGTLLELGRFRELISAFEAIILSESPELEMLPSGVAEPGHYTNANADVQGRAAAELATIACGWVLLHEVRHLQHQQDGTGAAVDNKEPQKAWAEELSCDEFATRFLLERVGEYAHKENVDSEPVSRKRQLGIYFALFAMAVLAKDNWGDTETHPSLQRRISAAHEAMKPNVSRIAYAIAQVAFAALQAIWPNAPAGIVERF